MIDLNETSVIEGIGIANGLQKSAFSTRWATESDHASIECKVSSETLNLKTAIRALQSNVAERDNSLIKILATAYKLYDGVESSTGDSKSEYEQDIQEMLSECKVKTPSKKTYTKIIRLVFNKSDMDRRQVSTYGNVLKNARLTQVRSTDFIKWLEDSGGINAASRFGNKVKSSVDLEEALRDIDAIEKIAIVPISDTSAHIVNHDFDFKLAFCKWDSATAQLTIYKLIEDEGKVMSAFKPFVSDVSEAVIAADEAELKTIKQQRRQSAVSVAAEELV
jgi:hypothetical protein